MKIVSNFDFGRTGKKADWKPLFERKAVFGGRNMATKPNYRTKQREQLLDYMKTVPGEHITVGDVCDYLHRQGVSIGQTTVYRQMERMVDEGLVQKYVIDINSPACFAYIPEDDHFKEGICFHCKCEKCGKLIHMNCEALGDIKEHLMEHHGFVLDPRRTVFYGVCEDCRANNSVK